MRFTKEQTKYIKYHNSCKLIACAGSGKTSCIIRKIQYLVPKYYKKNEILVLSFSKFAKTDFTRRCKELNYKKFINLNNILTIDSLAYNILTTLKQGKSKNVDTLTTKLLRALKTTKEKRIGRLASIKYIFIDEAQDLNSTQSQIFLLLLKDGFKVDLVGDPNQNIYQFRKSSDKYLLEFPKKDFSLTINFRSSKELVEFSNSIKPIDTKSVGLFDGKKPTIIDYDNFNLLKSLKGYERHKIAIISPKRNGGLSEIANILYKHNILFTQFYNESSEIESIQYLPEKEHINLLSYHGTKGLEWDLVIMMNCNYKLMNRKPTWEDNNKFQYLLYVASSRAKKELIMVYDKNIYPSILSIDSSLYNTNKILRSKNLVPEYDDIYTSVTEIIKQLTPEQLDNIDDLLNVHCVVKDIHNLKIDRKDPSLFGIFIEELFIFQYRCHFKEDLKEYSYIEYLDNIVHSPIKINVTSWDQYDLVKLKLTKQVRRILDKLDRRIRLEDYIITDQYIDTVNLKKVYTNYLLSQKYEDGIEDLFEIVLFKYCVDNGHTYHMQKRDKDHILENKELFEKINEIVKNYKINKDSINVNLGPINGKIDIILETVTEIKFTTNVTLKHQLQLYIYGLMYYKKETRDFKLINLYQGKEYTFNIKCNDILELLNIFLDAANLRLDLRIIYDLETTGLINYNVYPNIIQIAMKEFDYNIDIISTLVYTKKLPDFIKSLTGIQDVSDAPPLDEVKEIIKNRLRNINPILIAHNGAGFDDRIMKHYDIIKFDSIDSMTILGRKKLGELYKDTFKKIMPNAHDAMGDVNGLIELLKHFDF